MTFQQGESFISISEQVALFGKFRSNDMALIGEDRNLTWGDFNRAGNRIAHGLVAAGVAKGNCVTCLLPNNLRAYEIILGIWRAGAVVVPLSPLMTADTLASMIKDCEGKVLISDGPYGDLAKQTCEQAGINHIDVATNLDALTDRAKGKATDPCIPIAAQDLCNVIYSSGTTGTPKGIPHTQGGRLAVGLAICTELGFSRHSKAISVIPPHSNGAWLSWMPAFIVGCPTIILSAFEPGMYLEVVKREKPTHGFLVPTICGALLEHPEVESSGLDSFQGALTAGAPMPATVKQRMRALTKNGLWELWGLTESVATIISPKEMVERPDSVGRPMIFSDLRIIDEDDNDITGSGIGEIVGRSNSMMAGYLNRPEVNLESEWRASDGSCYFRTGDIGEIDQDGYLILRGRAKDMIISGGLNVYPVDIETILLQHQDIADAAVVGIEDEKWGEVPVAYVITQSGETPDLEAIAYWVNAQLAKHQRIKDMVVIDEFPRNTLGKVLKQELVGMYMGGST